MAITQDWTVVDEGWGRRAVDFATLGEPANCREALAPFRLADPPAVENQAAMVALGRPGAGEQLLSASGFTDVRRVAVPFAWEFADPETYGRTLAAMGPAHEAIRVIGEDAFREAAIREAAEHVRAGLPLRALIDVTGYIGRKG